jgi:hypothetical protein
MITAFKLCARAIFSLLEKTPPWFTKFEFKKFFSLFYIISTQRSYIYIYKKPDTNRCFAKLRAISNLFSFFWYTLYTALDLAWRTLLSERQFLLFSLWSATFVSLNSTFNCAIFFWRNSILRREGMKIVNAFRRRVPNWIAINNLSG